MQDALQTYHTGKVSIIIPVYNRELLLPETLNSILTQTYVNWECILVDDGSTDDSLSVCNSYAQQDVRFKVFSRPASIVKGANGCRNFGFQQSDGEFIQWFDSDDLMEIDLLMCRMNFFSETTAMLIVSPAKYFNTLSDLEYSSHFRKVRYIDGAQAYQFLAMDAWFQTSQCLLHRSLLKNEKSPFNTLLPRNQETALFVSLLLANPVLKVFGDAPFVCIRQHENSISGKYQSASMSKRVEMDLPAYRLMYDSFKRSNQLNDEVRSYFSIFFYNSVRQMNAHSFNFLKTFYFSWTNGLFPDGKPFFKLFFYRILGLC